MILSDDSRVQLLVVYLCHLQDYTHHVLFCKCIKNQTMGQRYT